MPAKHEGSQGDQERQSRSPRHDQIGEERGQAKSQKTKRPTRKGRRWGFEVPGKWREPITILTLVLCIITSLYTFFSWQLWRETAKSVELTLQGVEATKAALDFTEAALDLTEESNRLTRQGLRQSRRLGKESNYLTRESVQVASEGLAASREAFRLSERSRVIVEGGDLYIPASEFADEGIHRLSAPPEPNVTVTLHLHNGGRIPATIKSVSIAFYRRWNFTLSEGDAWRQDVIQEAEAAKTFRSFTIAPSGDRSIEVGLGRHGGQGLRQQEMVAFGKVVYSDDLGGPYLARLCLDYLPPADSDTPGILPLKTCGPDIVWTPGE